MVSSKKIKPNYRLLNNTISQRHKKNFPPLNENNFKEFLREKLAKVDFIRVRKDLEKFPEDKEEIKFINKETFLNLVNKF